MIRRSVRSPLVVTLCAAVALAGTAIPAQAGSAAGPFGGSSAVAAASWKMFGAYKTEAECVAVGESLVAQGLAKQYQCKRTGTLLMPLFQLWVA